MATGFTSPNLPAYIEDFYKDIIADATALGDTPFPFAPTQVAGLSPIQQQALGLATEGIGSYKPFLDQAATTMGTAVEGAAGAGFDPTAYQQFMNPYTQDVIDTTLDDIAKRGETQRRRAAGSAVGAGAFGGSRAAIQDAAIQSGTLRQQADTAARLRASGFQQAQASALAQAQQALNQAKLTGQLGTSQAGLGQLGQQMGVQDINTLLGIGGLQQQFGQQPDFTGQAFLTAEQKDAMAQQMGPFQQLEFMGGIAGLGRPYFGFQQQYTPPPSTLSQVIGGGLAGLGVYDMFNRREN